MLSIFGTHAHGKQRGRRQECRFEPEGAGQSAQGRRPTINLTPKTKRAVLKPVEGRSGKTYELHPESGALMSVERLQASLGCSPTYRARGLMILPVSYCSMA